MAFSRDTPPSSELVHPASHVLQLVEGRECALPQPIQLLTKDVNLVRLRPCKLKQPVQTHARNLSQAQPPRKRKPVGVGQKGVRARTDGG